MNDVVIRADSVGKLFQIGKVRDGNSFQGVLRTFRGMIARQREKATIDFWALKDVSFEVRRGESLGVVGGNGAGKSTLLKILSRITGPTRGRIDIWGRSTSLLEVGTGFMPVLTGRENVYVNGALLGMKRREIRDRFDQIVEFAEIGRYIDVPVIRYSSGMAVRLAFAIAAHLNPAVFIVDEVLAVGDQRFRDKCLAVMRNYVNDGGTILYVSHELGSVRAFCQRAIWLKGGRVQAIGDTKSVTEQYSEWSHAPGIYRGRHYQALISTIDVDNNLQGLELMLCPEPGQLAFRVELIRNWFTEDAISVTGHTSIEAGRWYCVSVTYSGEAVHEAMCLYVNGIRETRFEEMAGRGLTSRIDPCRTLHFGCRAGNRARLAGNVAFIHAENRCLSAAEVQSISERTLERPERLPDRCQSTYGGSAAMSAVQPDRWSLDLNSPFTVVAAFCLDADTENPKSRAASPEPAANAAVSTPI